MARKSYRKRYYRKKGRWSANIKNYNNTSITAPASSTFYSYETLCTNPAQNDSTVSQQYTVKNIELSYELDMEVKNGAWELEALTAYIMYVPQGMTVTETYPNNHPEYIMAYRFLGSPNVETAGDASATPLNPGRLPSKIKTRMARRLQTGDSIIFLITGYNNDNASRNLQLHALLRWWTKAN